MSVTVEKLKTAKTAKKQTEKKTAVDPLVAKVNRIVEIEEALKTFAPVIKEKESLLAELRAQTDAKPGSEQVVFAGDKGAVVFSARQKKTECAPMTEVRKVLGDTTFMACAKVTLSDIAKYATPEEAAKLLTEKPYTGPRSASIITDGAVTNK